MALNGIYVACAYAGSASPQSNVSSLLGRPKWTEHLSSNDADTAKSAPGANGSLGDPVFHVFAAEDALVCIGPSPDFDAPDAIILPIPAGQWQTIYVSAGDKASYRAA